MIHKVILPKIEPNMEEALLVEWLKQENVHVKKGESLFIIETAKTAIEVEAEESGILRKILVKEGETVPILKTIAFLGDENDLLPEISEETIKIIEEKEMPATEEQNRFSGSLHINQGYLKASPAAKRVARENNLNLNLIAGTGPEGRIIEEDVRKRLNRDQQKRVWGETDQKKRILIIGAGDGGEVVANILLNDKNNEIIGFLDDNQNLWKKTLLDRPVLGGIDSAEQLFQQKMFDCLIISITSNMKVRQAVYEKLKAKNYPFVNAVHPQAYVNPTARIGEGNIICAFVHLGHQAEIGSNNLISAHSNIEHHNKIGSHVLFGPGVMTSGRVTIGDTCSLGAGVNIEPHITIGNNTMIASGSTIINDVPANMVIRKELKRRA